MGYSAEAFKELGNVEIRKGGFASYTAAISHYTNGLSDSPDHIDLLSNRAFAYLQIGCYNSSLSDIHKVLALNPVHEKSLFRKVKALWGLNKYLQALTFLETEIPEEIQAKPDFQTLREKCHKMLNQSLGTYDIQELMTLPRNRLNEVAEYKGPVEIAEIPGKGRGLLATSDIQPGQLLICSKALALVFEEDAKKFMAIGDLRDYCVGTLCQKLSLEPSLRPKFFDLYSGPSDTVSPSSKTKTCEIDKDEVGIVDSILVYNGFSAEMDLSPWADKTPSCLGLWTLPSYINHSCMDATAYFYIYGDIMLVRALRELKKGQEVTICYTQPSNPSRRKLIGARDFKCDCSLCLMEDSESSEVRREVRKTLKLIQTEMESSDLNTQVSRVRKLIELRRDFPKTNLPLIDPAVEMVCSKLQDRGDHKTIAEIFEKSHEVAESNCYVMSSIYIAINLIRCYLALKSGDTVIGKWIKQLKLNLIAAYGTVEALKYLETEIAADLWSEAGIDIFDVDE